MSHYFLDTQYIYEYVNLIGRAPAEKNTAFMLLQKILHTRFGQKY